MPADTVKVSAGIFQHVLRYHSLTREFGTNSTSLLYSSSFRTAKNASVDTCTVPRERIRFLPHPSKFFILRGPRI